MSGKRVRFAVIGAGMIGAVHAAALAELPETAELVVIVDVDSAKALALAGSTAPSTPTT